MAMMEQLVLPPFVACAIVEHAKRCCNCAGYLAGSVSGDHITVTDYIPFTHESTSEVTTKAYKDELNERISVKKYYSSNITLIGWYAAGVPEENDEANFNVWCRAPSAMFLRDSKKTKAVMLLARMPSATNLSVRWEAHTMINTTEGRDSYRTLTQELAVSIEADTPSMNVLLSDIVSKAVYAGGRPCPMSRVTNLDCVALCAGGQKEADGGRRENGQKEAEARPLETELLNVQNKLHQAIAQARAVLASGSNSNTEAQRESAVIVKNYEAILEEKNQQSGRDDFITENYKDALMTKYTAALLRRHVMDIERHSRCETRERGHHSPTSTGPRKVTFR